MPEDLLLFDSKCNDSDSWVLGDVSQVSEQWERLWAEGEVPTGQSLGVTVSGVFDGPDGVGYGHMASYRTRLRISAVEILPRSRWRNDLPARAMKGVLSEAAIQVSAMEERLFSALFLADFAGLDDLLDENFILKTPTGAVLYRSQLAPGGKDLIESLKPFETAQGVQSSTVASHELDARTVLVHRTMWLERPGGSVEGLWKSPVLRTESYFTRVREGWRARFCLVQLEP